MSAEYLSVARICRRASDNYYAHWGQLARAGKEWGKWTCYNAGLHVPFYLQHRGMGFATHTGRVKHLLSLVDVMPSLVEMAGGSVPAGSVDGKSFTAVLKNHNHPEIHTHVYAVYNNRGVTCKFTPYPIRSILSVAGWKYIHNFNADAPIVSRRESVTPGCGLEGMVLGVPFGRDTCATMTRANLMYRESIQANIQDEMKWASLHRCRPADELYNLNTDVLERHNLAASSTLEHQAVRLPCYSFVSLLPRSFCTHTHTPPPHTHTHTSTHTNALARTHPCMCTHIRAHSAAFV